MTNKRIQKPSSKMSRIIRPLDVAPTIKATRWTLLLLGILYGNWKLKILREYEKTARVIRENKLKEKYARLAAESKEKTTEEVFILAKELGITDLPPCWSEDL